MRDDHVGRLFRMARLRRGLRLQDACLRADLSPATGSRLEAGWLDVSKLRSIRRYGQALGLKVELLVVGSGGSVPRLLDEEHAAIVEWLSGVLESWGWVVVQEASFNEYGERGRVDILAYHPATRVLLIVEVKTELTDLQALFGSLDAKERLAPGLARQRGWEIGDIVVLLAVASTDAARSVVASHPTVFGRFQRGPSARAWLRSPAGAASLLVYVMPEEVGRKRWLASRRRSRRASRRQHTTDARSALNFHPAKRTRADQGESDEIAPCARASSYWSGD